MAPIIDMRFTQYTFARIFGTDWLFDGAQIKIIDVDLVLSTKESSVV